MKKRILFLSEAVTLAQIVRLYSLAKTLDRNRYDIIFAASNFPKIVFAGADFQLEKIFSLSPGEIEFRNRWGLPIYSFRTLNRYLKDDIKLFSQIKPDLVIGDLRWSLSVSCAKCNLPYFNLINSYWSRDSIFSDEIPVPEHPIVSLLGYEIAKTSFPKAIPYVFARYARPVNDLRTSSGLSPLKELRDVLLDGDLVMFPDIPELVPLRKQKSNQVYLGPVIWSPNIEMPRRTAQQKRTSIYITLGSSGAFEKLPKILSSLSRLDADIYVASAGRKVRKFKSPNCYMSDFWPGDQMAKLAELVISNGGSTTGYQTLAQGTPVLGIPLNLDQYLATQAIENFGAGSSIRSGQLNENNLLEKVVSMLAQANFRNKAREVENLFKNFDYKSIFPALVDQWVG